MTIQAMRLAPEMASRKLQVLDFMRRYYNGHGVPPSLKEIAEACFTNKSRVQDAIRKLEWEGLVVRQAGKARGSRPVTDRGEVLRQLAAEGYIVNPPGMVLLDLDEDGRLTMTKGTVTKTGLPPAPAPAHEWDAAAGTSVHGTEAGREARSQSDAA